MSFSQADLYGLQSKFGPAPIGAQRRRSFRTPRCSHGLRCDPEPIRGARWLCESCACPWESPIDGAREPCTSARIILVSLVNYGAAGGVGARNLDILLEALERAGLVVGRRPTKAGIAYAHGKDFWSKEVTQ